MRVEQKNIDLKDDYSYNFSFIFNIKLGEK